MSERPLCPILMLKLVAKTRPDSRAREQYVIYISQWQWEMDMGRWNASVAILETPY